jgi:hypothetical protein
MNETPQIKEFHSGGKGTSPESPIPPTPSTNMVISITNPSANFVIPNPSSLTSLNSSSSGSVAIFSVVSN